jgi:hypothetical protein
MHRWMKGDVTLGVPFMLSSKMARWVVENAPRWVFGVKIDLVNLSLLAWFNLSLRANVQPECVLVDLALNAYGKVGVSLYDTLGDEAVGASVGLKRPTLLETNFKIS